MNEFPIAVVGTYEEFVLGYQIKSKNDGFNFEQSFATHTHQASIRCIASHGKYLATSGADENINIYNMVTLEVSHVLNYHEATVTCLEFTPDGSHLISANQNGDIVTFRCQDWAVVKVWKESHAQGNGVICTSVHPSGGLLLSIGGDNTLRFWNLIKGRQAYAINLSKKISPGNTLNVVKWSKDGDYYSVAIGRKVEIYLVKTAALVYEAECPVRISSMDFSENGTLFLGTDEGFVELHRINTKALILRDKCHETRVKCLSSISVSDTSKEISKVQKYVISADSNGIIKLWRIKKKKPNYFLKLKGEVDADCRITCLSTVSMEKVKEEKNEPTSQVELNKKLNEASIELSSSLDQKSDGSTILPSNKIIENTKRSRKIKPVPRPGSQPPTSGETKKKFENVNQKKRKRSMSGDGDEMFYQAKKKKNISSNEVSGQAKAGKFKQRERPIKKKSKLNSGKWIVEAVA